MKTTGDHTKEEDKPVKIEEKKPFFSNLHWFTKLLIFLIIALLIIGGIRYANYLSSEKVNAAERALIAQELTANNITLYTTSTCPHCKTQKALFGDEIRYLRVVTCDLQPDEFCGTLNAVPTWRLPGPNNQVIVGSLTMQNLKELVVGCTPQGCNLKNNFEQKNTTGDLI